VTGGKAGSAPGWYTTLQAARYAGVDLWELWDGADGLWWQERILLAAEIERDAAKPHRGSALRARNGTSGRGVQPL
jgi:hypothetical protein